MDNNWKEHQLLKLEFKTKFVTDVLWQVSTSLDFSASSFVNTDKNDDIIGLISLRQSMT